MGKRGRQSWTHLMEREGPEQARKEVKNLKLMLTCLRCLVACIITTYSSHAKERLSTGVRDFRDQLGEECRAQKLSFTQLLLDLLTI